jgi:hypothetical protein
MALYKRFELCLQNEDNYIKLCQERGNIAKKKKENVLYMYKSKLLKKKKKSHCN